jgi:hypothetical protein
VRWGLEPPERLQVVRPSDPSVADAGRVANDERADHRGTDEPGAREQPTPHVDVDIDDDERADEDLDHHPADEDLDDGSAHDDLHAAAVADDRVEPSKLRHAPSLFDRLAGARGRVLDAGLAVDRGGARGDRRDRGVRAPRTVQAGGRVCVAAAGSRLVHERHGPAR